MTDDIFSVSVPDTDLEAPAFELLPTGAYRTTLTDGTELVSNNSGWKAIRLPFNGFTAKDGKTYARSQRAQFTYESKNADAQRIGNQAIIGAAAALGLTETVTVDGKSAQKLTATSMEQLVEQFKAMAGTDVEVYVKLRPRKKAGQIVQRMDGNGPIMDNEISNVRAVK